MVMGVTAESLGAPGPKRRRSAVVGGQPVSGREWQELRARWQARLPQPCPRCDQDVQVWDVWDLDHVGDPVALGGRTGIDHIRPAHRGCNRAAGMELGIAIRRAGVAALRGEFFPGDIHSRGSRPDNPSPDGRDAPRDPETPAPDSGAWESAPWLAEFLNVPANATWPRLMTAVHPDAVGSYGAECIDWIRSRFGLELRWWQRLVITRILEHDDAGQLVWQDAVISTARQVGKSFMLTALAAWRMNSAYTFAETQTVMHTGKDLAVCREVHRPGRVWAKANGYSVRETNGQEEITAEDGSRWIVRAQNAVYGYPVTLGLVDEAWSVQAERVEDGLEPTLSESTSGQLLLFSTAHRKATSLVPLRRAACFAAWANPASTLLLEWSATRDAKVEDRDAWRLASPHWTPARERLLEAKMARISQGLSEDPDEDDAQESFRSQFLNVWPLRALVPGGKAEPLTDRQTWDQRRDEYASPPPEVVVTVAIEDWYGMGAAGAACVALADGRLLTWGGVFANRQEAYAWAAFTVGKRHGCRVLVGATLGVAEAEAHIPEAEGVYACNTTTTRAALPLVRSLILSGRLAHSGDPDMAEQVSTVRLIASPNGGLVFAHGDSVRPDLLKAMAWAVADQAEPVTAAPDWFVF